MSGVRASVVTRSWVAALGAALFFAVVPLATAHQRALLAKIDSDDFGLPAPESLGEPLRLWATWYHIPVVDAARDGFRLPGVGGKPISPPISGREWCQAALQGVMTIREQDGLRRTYTYEGTGKRTEVDCQSYHRHASAWARAAGRSRFGVSKGPFGDGAGNYQLVPYRSVAVGTHLIPLGTVLFIPAARSVAITLPSGRKVLHDGYFFASDRGGDIHQDHIDVFVGDSSENPFPSFVLSTSHDTFEAYIVDDGLVKPRLRHLHSLD